MFPLLSMPIMAHHAGLYDYTDFTQKMKAELPVGIGVGKPLDVKLDMPKGVDWQPQDFHHLTRVLYSCLVDADFLDTEELYSCLSLCSPINLRYAANCIIYATVSLCWTRYRCCRPNIPNNFHFSHLTGRR